MLSVKAIYDGHNLRLLENIEINSPQEVIITFLEKDGDDISGKIIQSLVSQNKSMEFLRNDDEDIYSDADLKVI